MATEIDLVKACIDSYPVEPTKEAVEAWTRRGYRSVAGTLLKLTKGDEGGGPPPQVLQMLHEYAARTIARASDRNGPAQRLWELLRGAWKTLPPVDQKAAFDRLMSAARRGISSGKKGSLLDHLKAASSRGKKMPDNKKITCPLGERSWSDLSQRISVTERDLIQQADFFEDSTSDLRYRRHGLGDFLASNVMGRLEDITRLVRLSAKAFGQPDPRNLEVIHSEAVKSIWETSDADDRQYSWTLLQICWAGTKDADVRRALLPAGVPCGTCNELVFKMPAFDQKTGETVREAMEWLLSKLETEAPPSSPAQALSGSDQITAALGKLTDTIAAAATARADGAETPRKARRGGSKKKRGRKRLTGNDEGFRFAVLSAWSNARKGGVCCEDFAKDYKEYIRDWIDLHPGYRPLPTLTSDDVNKFVKWKQVRTKRASSKSKS